mmetsp:Transcript_38122/g.122387  ORF Transcript_38122/g.122387 Transcript_38122/m.122387 type:complete len:245 (-) Transcript_38122:122-856(-)|eukprot:CAMPEP_0118910794 /NCGR_PEP_ID=MMETSP1166-20130328/12778_1 /TAXON_ID=1104430 /ORGANISM="Chrysoreinhardia sp, Strain CCMP3193" /LENGTH=244 /DNA_ID=CAMNT_0006850269 /DNA_START=85 /DNA_END=819 /DNA_ORIENTATION=-
MSFEQLRQASLGEIDALETSLPEKIMEIDGRLGTLASSSLPEIEGKFAKATTTKVNETVASLVSYARSEAATCILNLSKFERFVGLSVPRVEDGNNFGVAIQLEVRKMIAERRQKLKELFDKLADYHKDRAALWKDVAPRKATEAVEHETKTTDDVESSKVDDNTHAVKTTAKTSTETKTTTNDDPLPDALAAVVALDVSWYFHLYYVIETVRDSYINVGDVVNKNKTRLTQPKGDGQSVMSMF